MSACTNFWNSPVAECIRTKRLIVVLRRTDPLTVDALVDKLFKSGIELVEFTMDTPGACDLIRKYRERTDRFVGAGTVLTVEQAEWAINAGAQYLVSPVYDPMILETATEHGVPMIPGCMTPTEIYQAWRNGATYVKLFPAGIYGSKGLKSLLKPLSDIPIIVSGGILVSEMQDYLDAGAVAVAVSGTESISLT